MRRGAGHAERARDFRPHEVFLSPHSSPFSSSTCSRRPLLTLLSTPSPWRPLFAWGWSWALRLPPLQVRAETELPDRDCTFNGCRSELTRFATQGRRVWRVPAASRSLRLPATFLTASVPTPSRPTAAGRSRRLERCARAAGCGQGSRQAAAGFCLTSRPDVPPCSAGRHHARLHRL